MKYSAFRFPHYISCYIAEGRFPLGHSSKSMVSIHVKLFFFFFRFTVYDCICATLLWKFIFPLCDFFVEKIYFFVCRNDDYSEQNSNIHTHVLEIMF